MVKILQGSVVTKTMLGGLTTYRRVSNFLQYTCAKNYENWLAVDKVIAKISRLTFLAHPVYAMFSGKKCFYVIIVCFVFHIILSVYIS